MQASCAHLVEASVFDSRSLADAWPGGRQHDEVVLLQVSSDRLPQTGGLLFGERAQHGMHLGLGCSD